ncbi:MAG TPA: hypothetical protein VN697_03360 [Tepidiformaceae bacterium]|nr:hypothetical protein [Tepidiformaceae bacterium]
MTQIAVLNGSSKLANIDVTFLVEACAQQLYEFCQRWNLDPWAIGFYASTAGLPADDIYIFVYVDQLDVDGALAYHSVDALGRPYGRMLPPDDKLDATDLSHEILETRGDPTCDRWFRMPDGVEIAVEVADPVQADAYAQEATVLGETRKIKVSNYVLPAFFEASNASGPYDRLGNLRAPFQIAPGGYAAELDATGNEHDVFARRILGDVPPHKLMDVGGRLLRRLRTQR